MIQTRTIGSYRLESGIELPKVDVAYASYGRLAADGRNAVLVAHGFTSGPAMLSSANPTAEGSWAPLLGPGRPLDTDRYFIVCSNMLGSSFGTTGPASIDPVTGRPYGPDFPDITLGDIVGVQRQLLDQLGVCHLRAVLGPSYGGWQALQWALAHPGMVDAIGVLVSGLRHPPGLSAASQRARLAASPEWHGGWHYEHGRMYRTLIELRRQTLRSYGLERLYLEHYPDPQERHQAMERSCHEWASRFDPNSLVALAGAAERFDVRDRLHAIRARMLFMVCTTDAIFPPDPQIKALVENMPAPHRYVELDSPFGHMASGVEWQRLEEDLRWLLPSE